MTTRPVVSPHPIRDELVVTDCAASIARWTLLSNHGHVLLYVAKHPTATVRAVGDAVGITERAAARILRELRLAGYLRATRIGRGNSYDIDYSRPLRHPSARRWLVGDLMLGLLDDRPGHAPNETTSPARSRAQHTRLRS